MEVYVLPPALGAILLTTVLLFLGALFALAVVLPVVALVRVLINQQLTDAAKAVWALVLVCFYPLGAYIYTFFAERSLRLRIASAILLLLPVLCVSIGFLSLNQLHPGHYFSLWNNGLESMHRSGPEVSKLKKQLALQMQQRPDNPDAASPLSLLTLSAQLTSLEGNPHYRDKKALFKKLRSFIASEKLLTETEISEWQTLVESHHIKGLDGDTPLRSA